MPRSTARTAAFSAIALTAGLLTACSSAAPAIPVADRGSRPATPPAATSPGAAPTATCTRRTPDDFNGDGRADLVTSERSRQSVRVLYGADAGPGTGAIGYFDAATFAGLHIGATGGPSATGFFNADCYADAVIAAQDDSGQGWDGAGRAVALVVYGSPAGLDPASAVVFPIAALDPTSHASFSTEAVGDFNGDGFDDAAISAPGFVTDEDSADDGGVAVLYGSRAGLALAGHQWFDRDTAGVPRVSGTARGFGDAVAAADFTGDGKADLAIGMSGWSAAENRPGTGDRGYVLVMPGSPAGLTMAGDQVWTPDSPGVADSSQLRAGFGAALAAGDVTGDGRPDLLIGAPLRTVGRTNAGEVLLLVDTPAGLSGTGSHVFSRSTPGVPGDSAADVEFGATLAIGDFNGDGYGDAAIGTPKDDIGSAYDAGSVTVLYGGRAGLTTTGAQLWTQPGTGVPDPTENVDGFGARLTVLTVSSPHWSDLVVGAPGESSGGHRENGAIIMLPGGADGLSATGSRFLDATALPGGAVDGGGFA